jgi:hypothetical protein
MMNLKSDLSGEVHPAQIARICRQITVYWAAELPDSIGPGAFSAEVP